MVRSFFLKIDEFMMVNISIIIPAFNEQDNLPALAADIHTTLQQAEIIIIDDCSTDNTEQTAQQLLARYPSIKYIRHAKRSGQSCAVSSGVKHASHEVIATIDGDGQNPPSEILKLLEAYKTQENPASILFAGHRQQRQDTWVKRLSSRIANKIRMALLRDNCPDTGCGLKLFHKTAFLSLPQFNHMHRFLPALFKRNGMMVVNVPISHKEREHGKSKYNTWGRLKVGVVDLLGVAWLARRPCNPKLSIVETAKHE